MLTVSKAVGAAQALDYYKNEYTNASESYSTEQLSGEWHGRLAEKWELRGAVEREQYERLCEGQHPLTGEQLVRHAPARTYENKFGDEITSVEHRAGWDLTFSAPKSVSLSAVAGGDERVRLAHRESVDRALDEVEAYTQARIGGNNPAETTGQMVAAKFEHDAARPDRLMGYAAPQLHTHALVFNVTELEDGRTRALQPYEMYRSQQFATAVYRMELADRLQQLGYEIEIDERTGAPEIKGYSSDYLRESSPRSAELRREAELMKARLEADGATVKDGAGLRQAAARTDRSGKEYDREAMREHVVKMEERHGYQAHRLYEQSIERGPLLRSQEEALGNAREAVGSARDMALESGAAVDVRKVWTHALRQATGLSDYGTLKGVLDASMDRGEFMGLVRDGQMGADSARSMTPAGELHGQRTPSLEQSAERGSGLALDSFEGGNDAVGAGAKEMAEEQAVENAIELGFAL